MLPHRLIGSFAAPRPRSADRSIGRHIRRLERRPVRHQVLERLTIVALAVSGCCDVGLIPGHMAPIISTEVHVGLSIRTLFERCGRHGRPVPATVAPPTSSKVNSGQRAGRRRDHPSDAVIDPHQVQPVWTHRRGDLAGARHLGTCSSAPEASRAGRPARELVQVLRSSSTAACSTRTGVKSWMGLSANRCRAVSTTSATRARGTSGKRSCSRATRSVDSASTQPVSSSAP